MAEIQTEKKKEELAGEIVVFKEAPQLVEFMDQNDMLMHLSKEEAEMLLAYTATRAVQIGFRGEEIVCCDLCSEGKMSDWKSYSIDDAVNDACDSNYDMIVQAEAEFISKLYTEEAEEIAEKIKNLHSDEAVLDSIFDRTKYGKEVEEVAHQLAQAMIEDMRSDGGLDAAIERMKKELEQRKDLLPEVSSALKKKTDRAR